jgi:mono/diheme cytochrome c family protein
MPLITCLHDAARLPRWAALGVLALGSAWLPLAGQAPEVKGRSVPELKTFFQQHCTRCHGLDGSAQGPDGQRLGGLDFTKVALESRSLSGPATDREIRSMSRTIRRGILFGYTMPAWGQQLTLEDATLLVREVLLKAEKGVTIEPAP